MLIIFSLMQTRVTMENGKPGRAYEQTTADTYLPHNEAVHFALKANLLLNKIVGIKINCIKYPVLIVKCEKHTITLFVLTPGGILLFPIYMPVCVCVGVGVGVGTTSLSLYDTCNCVLQANTLSGHSSRPTCSTVNTNCTRNFLLSHLKNSTR